jgi:soluble lytic murein transglycosylase-like protein
LIRPPATTGRACGRVGPALKARILGALLLAAGVLAPSSLLASEPTTREAVEARIAHYAAAYGIPYALLHKVVKSESTFNPAARNGPYWGLMQIRHDTAKGLGYAGSATGLLDAETNLIYGGAYLANAYMIAGGNSQQAHNLYRKGYYYEAKRKRLLSRLLKIPMGMVPVMVAGQTVAQPKTGGEIAAPVLLASSEAPEPAALRPAPAIVADAPMIKPVA